MNSTNTQNNSMKKGITDLFNRLSANPRVPLIVAAAAVIAVVIAMVLWAKQPDYRVLYNNLSNEDGGAIVTQLDQMNIPYQFDKTGGALMVPADKVHELRLRLASQGLPKGGAVGFELLDKEKFGISQFSEQVNYQRALEGELSRTIETLGPVKGARVHLAMPKPSLFVREQKSPSASVTLILQPGRALDDGQINAVVHMVASSVAAMPPANVTIVDQSGRLLTRSDAAGRDLNDAQLKYASEVEARYQQRIEAILGPIVGSNNVHAQVTAQIDFNAREQTDEQYQPNSSADKQAIRSRQSSNSEQLGAQYPGGVPGALSNQPAPASSGPVTTPANNNNATNGQQNNGQQNNGQQNNGQQINGQQGNNNNSGQQRILPSNTRNDDTTNYELNRTIVHTKLNTGSVERLSVAVVVNYHADASGKAVALSEAQIKQIENLTREAMGFSGKRGDSLQVVNSPFTAGDDDAGDLPFWKQSWFIDQMLSAGRWLLVLLATWILYRKLVRPHLQRITERNKAVAEAAAAKQADKAVADEDEDGVDVQLSGDEKALQRKSQHRMSAELMSQRIQEMTENDPRITALVIRQWMKEEL